MTGLGGKSVSHTTKESESPKIYPTWIKEVLERANRGDASVVPELKKVYDENPEFVERFGDLTAHAEKSFITLIAGPSLMGQEAIARQVAGLRARLAASAASELETLLIDRIALSWLAVYHSDIDLAHYLLKGADALPAVQAASKRLDRSHARFLAAVRTLATVRKLVKPALSPLELAARPVPEKAARRAAGNPADGVPVAN
jgi:hypothetical protein